MPGNVVTYPGVKGSFLRFELQSPINRTSNTWHIQADHIFRLNLDIPMLLQLSAIAQINPCGLLPR